MVTDTAGSTTSRMAGVYVLADDCAPNPNGTHLERVYKMGHPEALSTPSQAIIAGRQFHFVAHYADSGYAVQRGCAVEARFHPLPDREYKGVIFINGDVTACDLGIYDVTAGSKDPVPFEMPPMICPIQGAPAKPNGQATRVDWVTKVVPY